MMKNIACGQPEEYIKIHEAIVGYDELRGKVLQMTVLIKTESNIKTHKPEPMDISEIIKEVIQKFKGGGQEQAAQPSEVEEKLAGNQAASALQMIRKSIFRN